MNKRSTKGADGGPIMAKRYVAATGSGYSEDDAQLIGTELARIAKANRTDVASLDKVLVYERVEKTPDHPLRKFYEWDDAKAARSHRLTVTGNMIRCIRTVDFGHQNRNEERPVPEFVYVPNGTIKAGGNATRSRVLTDDVLANDPMFANALGHKIRMVKHAVDGLAWLARSRSTAPEVAKLVNDLESALDVYLASVAVSDVG
jgi:hypothetical protein